MAANPEELEMEPMDEEGEVVDLEEVPDIVEETDDGGAIVTLDEEADEDVEEQGFYDNIIDTIEQTELDQIATKMVQMIDYDKKSRSLRDEQYTEAIKRTGLGKEAPGGAEFQGASRAVHPMLSKGSIDFGSRTIAELFPANGPVKDYIPGEPSAEQMVKAKRKVAFMNWQFVKQMPEFRPVLEQGLSQVPLGGSQYLGLRHDSKRRRPVPAFIPIDDVYLPYAADSFYTAERVTVVDHVTEMEFNSRVKDGIYRDDGGGIVTSTTPEQTKAAEASEKVEGKSHNWYNEDGLRDIYNVMCYLDIEDEYGEQPYLIDICSVSHKILSVVRNWDRDMMPEKEMEDLPRQDAMYWMVELGFIPWRGAYHIGLGQLIGSLSGAATGALRALLDSAHIQNFPSLAKLKGANFSGQTQELNATSITEIEGGVGADADIRKLLMAIPYNPTSPVLMNLLMFLIQEGNDVVRTVFDKLGDVPQNAPVGTTLALIEQAMKVFNAIHLRLVNSMSRIIEILQRINRMYLTDEEIKRQCGKQLAYAEDFDKPDDVIPTADPEIFSDVQRWGQVQLVAQRAFQNPLYDQRKVEEMILSRAKIADAESLLVPEAKPEEMNAVNENLAMVMGRPVAAFPEQDHLAHIQILLDFMQHPMFGMLPIIAPTFLGAALNHLKDHMVMWYVDANVRFMERETGKDVKSLMQFRDPKTRAEMDKTLASASPEIMAIAEKMFQKIPEIIAKAQQALQQYAPPPMMDPSQAALQAKQIDADTAAKKTAADLQKSREGKQSDLQKEMLKQNAEDNRTKLEIGAKQQMNREDNLTALTIAQGEIDSGEKVALSTGTGINPGS